MSVVLLQPLGLSWEYTRHPSGRKDGDMGDSGFFEELGTGTDGGSSGDDVIDKNGKRRRGGVGVHMGR
jgi:hypothetical protein